VPSRRYNGGMSVRAPGILTLACLLAALSATPEPLLAGEPDLRERRNGPVTVRFSRGTESEAEVAAREMPEILADVSNGLGIPPPASVEIRILAAAEFEAMVGPRRGEWAVAVAYSSRSLIAVNPSRLDLGNDLYTTLAHEAIHLLLGALEAETGNPIPLWFHEGVAQVLCGRLFAGSRQEFLAAAAAGTLFPFEQLDRSFPDEGAAVPVAYAQSESFVQFLDRRYPPVPEAVLAAMNRGLSFPEAFREVIGEDVPSAEAQWRKDLSKGPPLFAAWFQDNPELLIVLLLAIGGVLLALAFFIVRRRRKDALDHLDGEDPADEDDDDPGGEDVEGEEDDYDDEFDDGTDDDGEDGWWKGEEEYH